MHATQLCLPQPASRHSRLLAVLTAALLALTLSTSPANADSHYDEQGTTNCPSSSPFSSLTFTTVGNGYYQAPGATQESYIHYGSQPTKTYSGAMYGGSWWVNASQGDIENAYGSCSSYG